MGILDNPIDAPTRAALDSKVGKGELMVNPKDYGAKGNGSTDDTLAVQQAVSYAKTNDAIVYWPRGSFNTTSSIADLHNVQHAGNGWVYRDGKAFFPSPNWQDTNTLFVDPNGTPTNDGLSPAQPMDVQTAMNKLQNYGPTLDGRWIIQHAPGTYPGGYAMPWLKTRRAVEFVGPNMGGPRIKSTVIYDRGASTTVKWGITTSDRQWIRVADIAFQNFNNTAGNGAADAGAIRINEFGQADLWNLDISNCTAGIYPSTSSRYSFAGCRIYDCYFGATELWFVTRATSVDSATRNIIERCTYGIKGKELCTGHGDFTEFNDNLIAVHLSRGSTMNFSDAIFNRNQACVVTSADSSFVPIRITLGTGVDKNTVFARYMQGGANILRVAAENTLSAPYIGMVEKSLAYGKAAAFTGSTTDTQLVPLGAFKAGDFQGEGSWMRFEAYGLATMVSSTTLLRLRIGGTSAVAITLPTGTNYSWKFEGTMYVTADGDLQRIDSVLWRSNGNPIFAGADRTTTFSTTDYTFGLYAQLGGTTDSIQVYQARSFTTEM